MNCKLALRGFTLRKALPRLFLCKPLLLSAAMLCFSVVMAAKYAECADITGKILHISNMSAERGINSKSAERGQINTLQAAELAKAEEQHLGARIGIAVGDKNGNILASYRGNERFPLNSTHKALICAALLHEIDSGKFALSDKTEFSAEKLVTYSPITAKQTMPAQMDWQNLCSAAVSYSDNTAANLITEKLGGAKAVTQFLRSIGDGVTQMDRLEPELNMAGAAGDNRDTTTPIAVSQTFAKLLFADILSTSARSRLVQWLYDDKVADNLLRASLPSEWKIADKSGAGEYGSRSVIAAVFPHKADIFVLSVYITQTRASMAERNAAIARIGKVIFSSVEQTENQEVLPQDKQ